MKPPEIARWFANAELFREQLGIGKMQELMVAAELCFSGFRVTLSPALWGDTVKERQKHAGDTDLWVNTPDGGGIPLEVKSRDLAFTAISDFPYQTVFIDTVQGFDVKREQPVYTVVTSQQTGKRIVIPTRTKDEWKTEKVWDAKRKIPCVVYTAPLSCCISWEDFLEEVASASCGEAPTS